MSFNKNQTSSDEWYTDKDVANLCLDLLKIDNRPETVLMCPFDTDQSQYVQQAHNRSIMTISGIRDFIDSDHYRFDYLATNPPFSLKDKVIETCLKYGKPTALILPIDSLSGVKRHQLFKQYGYPSIYVPTRRISFYDQDWQKRNSANFSSIIMLLNTGESRLIWE